MKFFLKLYVLLSFWSCSQPYKDWNVIERYPSGKTKIFEFKYDNSGKTYRRIFYESGKLSAEESYLDNLEDGVFTFWYENGNKKREIYYSQGILDSFFYDYHSNGVLKSRAIVKNDTIQGRADYYTEEGFKDSWAFFVNNELYFVRNFVYDDIGNLVDSTDIFSPKIEFDTITDPSKVVITVRLPLDKNIFPIDSVYAEYSCAKELIKPDINTLMLSSSNTYTVGKGFEITYIKREDAIEDYFFIRFYYKNGDQLSKLKDGVYPINFRSSKK